MFTICPNYSFKGNSHRTDVCPLNSGVRRIKKLAVIEILLGLCLVAICCYLMLESVYFPATDRHGYLLGLTLFGASLGGLLAFAGVSLLMTSRYRLLGHMPIVLYSVASYATFAGAYT